MLFLTSHKPANCLLLQNASKHETDHMSAISIHTVTLDMAADLAPLIAAHAQDVKRGAPRNPDIYYSEKLLTDTSAEVLGATIEGVLSGFALFFDLPEAISGMRRGYVEIIYVDHKVRGSGITRALIDQLTRIGEDRKWLDLRWHDPDQAARDKVGKIKQKSISSYTEISFPIAVAER